MNNYNNSNKRVIRFNPEKFVGKIEDLYKFKKNLKECKDKFDSLYDETIQNLDTVYKDRKRMVWNLDQRYAIANNIQDKWELFRNNLENLVNIKMYNVWDMNLVKEMNLDVVLEYVK